MSKFRGRVYATVMIDLGESDDIHSFLGDDVELPAYATVETAGCVIESTHVDVLDERVEWLKTRKFNKAGHETPCDVVLEAVIKSDITSLYVNSVRAFSVVNSADPQGIVDCIRDAFKAAGMTTSFTLLAGYSFKDKTWEEIDQIILDRLQQVE